MTRPKIKKLPDVEAFESLHLDPDGMTVTLQYRPSQKTREVCEIQFTFPAASKLAALLCEMLDIRIGSAQFP